MKLSLVDLFASFLIFIIAGIFVFDVFLTPGRPASFDTPFHITNIAQFQLGLQSGDFPVVWTDGVANYGLPMSIVAHQLTNYFGALITFISGDPVLSFNIILFVGIFLSSLFYYFFLRIYFNPIASFGGTYLFTFSTYKIINLYVRGAMPEIFSGIFLPLILIGLYFFIKKEKIWGFFLLIISFFLLTLNHPMMLLIYAFVFFPYFVFLLITDHDHVKISLIANKLVLKKFFFVFLAIIVGVGMGSYYLLPLNLEIKYFYYGLVKNHLTPNSYLSVIDYVKTDWRYFTPSEVFTRGHIIHFGLIETIGVILGIGVLVWNHIVKRKKTVDIVDFAVLTSIVLILFTSPVVDILYNHISILSNIQFPWRMLSALLFLPPIIFAYVFSMIKRDSIVICFIIVVSVLSFPQLYGKNFVMYPIGDYYFTPYNVHSVLMNTIWSGKTEEYPVKNSKPEIIEGKGKIVKTTEKNSSRQYTVEANTPVRMVDYTFYFPGWQVKVDGNTIPIEFQDPEYRGVITYNVPQGTHDILLSFEDTKVRMVGKVLSLFFFACFVVLIVFHKRLSLLFQKQ